MRWKVGGGRSTRGTGYVYIHRDLLSCRLPRLLIICHNSGRYATFTSGIRFYSFLVIGTRVRTSAQAS